MHKDNIDLWQHSHVFGQEQKRSGEKRTLIVVALTLVMMIWEIAAGWSYGDHTDLLPEKRSDQN